MNVIDSIKERLQDYPHVRYEVSDNSITVFPTSENGFEASMYLEDCDGLEPYVVYYDGAWHEHFSDAEEALDCFAFGLPSQCRLKVTSRGDKPYMWTVEFFRDGMWGRDATTALFSVRFWKKKNIKYFQNDLIKSEVKNIDPTV